MILSNKSYYLGIFLRFIRILAVLIIVHALLMFVLATGYMRNTIFLQGTILGRSFQLSYGTFSNLFVFTLGALALVWHIKNKSLIRNYLTLKKHDVWFAIKSMIIIFFLVCLSHYFEGSMRKTLAFDISFNEGFRVLFYVVKEEIIFRAFLFEVFFLVFRRHWLAIFLSSFYFGMFHIAYLWQIKLLGVMFGIAFTLVYLRSGKRLIYPIWIHFIWNLWTHLLVDPGIKNKSYLDFYNFSATDKAVNRFWIYTIEVKPLPLVWNPQKTKEIFED